MGIGGSQIKSKASMDHPISPKRPTCGLSRLVASSHLPEDRSKMCIWILGMLCLGRERCKEKVSLLALSLDP